MTLIVIFAASFILASFVLVLKAIELRSGKSSIFLSPIRRFDPLAISIFDKAKFRLLQTIQTVRYLLLVKLKETSLQLFESKKNDILRNYKARQDSFMGKKDIKNKGASSFYLKKIEEDKESGGKGRIEEELI